MNGEHHTETTNPNEKGITVTGLEPNTEYTFHIQAVINDDNARGPERNLTHCTAQAGELY